MADVECRIEGRIGRIHLNRPKALNALTHPMVVEIGRSLARWHDDDRVIAVLVTGEGERAFCAGGDVREIWRLGREGQKAEALRFFHDEYRMNWRIKHFPKPYVSLLDGIVMGGGVGLSEHGSHRVATEATVFAMPETAIGMFPDVGGTYVLSRLQGGIGRWLALTSERLGAADALEAGIASHYVPRAKLAEVRTRIERALAPEEVVHAVEDVAEPPPPGEVAARSHEIASVFGHDRIEAIRAAAMESDWGRAQWATLEKRSPTACRLALEQLRRGRTLDFDACMVLEYRIVHRILDGHDFYEGVRAVLVDKDHAPRWSPSTLDAVEDAAIEAYFAPPETGDLAFDWDVGD
ncbi:MAG: enoyl-CoA hydratase/isomerase family protein [Pseudomonadota bacterium]